MKTEDELDAEVAKLFDEVKTAKVEMVNGKPRISDQATLDQMEREEAARRMEKACCMFLTAERRFQKLCDHPDKVTDPKVNVAWWESLDRVESMGCSKVATTEEKTQLIGGRSQLGSDLQDGYRKIEVAFALGAIEQRG